jgi:hypothetical protein
MPIQIQAKLTTQLILRRVTEEPKALEYRLTILCLRSQVDKQYGQIV